MKNGLKIGAAALAGALTMGAFMAAPVFGQDDPSTETAPAAGSLMEHRAERRAARQEAIAAELGIDVDTYRAAVQAARTAVHDELGPLPSEPSPEDFQARRDAFESALASELGIDVQTLETAVHNVVSAKIDEAQSSGRITEQRADELRQALADGTLRQQIRERWQARRGG